jgi:dihydropteroate synthase
MKRKKIMGVLNVTPDSFSDGGMYDSLEKAILRGKQIEQEGADILDIGGESTRPASKPVSEEEELRRVVPVVEALAKEITIPISVDTQKAFVAEKALEAGASIINDVSGFRDPAMRKVAAKRECFVVCMHMLGTPETMQKNPQYKKGVVEEIVEWAAGITKLLQEEGVEKGKIILDPGIGFGKTVADNLEILQNLHKIRSLGFPVLVGASRKSFMAKLTSKTHQELVAETLAVHSFSWLSGADIVRVHDVSFHFDFLQMWRLLFNSQTT